MTVTCLPTKRAFSLVELLVAIGIIAVLGILTAISVRGITKDARMSSAVNTVTASLGEARALAMKNNTIVAVVFRPRWDTSDQSTPQFTEVVIAKWSGETQIFGNAVVDRFVPFADVPPRPLPPGIKVAGPWYDIGFVPGGAGANPDEAWITQTEFRAQLLENEIAGRLFAIQYGPDGQVLTRNSLSDADELYVDFDGDGNQRLQQFDASLPDNFDFWENDHPNDENSINPVPFLAVYDDEEARELKTQPWSSSSAYQQQLAGPNGYITKFGRRIHFNRYTGVVMSSENR